jgi:cysteinyl-tRNA synthetase
LYDTAKRAVRDFEPRIDGRVGMYVCGPTVYDVPHVGHGRTAVVFDVVRRYLEWRGFTVSFVSNVTDVEDRIIERAAERGTTEPELAARYEREYWDQMDRLGITRPTEMPHATEFVDAMLGLIAQLVASGAAYVIEGQGVYFSVASYPGYGDLSHRRLADLLEGAGARVEVDELKRSPVDFALWKAAKPGEPSWGSPWGPGRPGWHIECSAMSLEILGDGFDIHGGGDDLVFPHHENERAQAEAAGHAFARYWMHSGMVVVGTEKMSKSLGNFTNLSDALDRHGARAFRMLVLQTQYRRPIEIGDTELHQAAAAVERLDAFARRARVAGVEPSAAADVDAFVAAMDHDIDTPAALAVIFDVVRRGNAALDAGATDDAARALATVDETTRALGLAIDDGLRVEGDEEIERLVAARDAARDARDFEAADRIRDDLAARGVTVEDTPHGTLWRR